MHTLLGITCEMEAALAFAMQHIEPPSFDDSKMPSEPFIQLRDAGMLNMTTDGVIVLS